MAANVEKLKADIAKTREEINKIKATAGTDKKKFMQMTMKLRKTLKRQQRKLVEVRPYTTEERMAFTQKVLDKVTARQSDMQKNTKKRQGDANVHSLAKKIKTLNKQIKRLKKIQTKAKEAAAPPKEQPAAQAPAAQAPAAQAPAAQAPAAAPTESAPTATA